ncbi:tyrosine-type recombinase/integrase [Streptomyces sp. A73]|nr:tyrosine-type recombinase/integrase [Streptomyces sp. A73]
MDDQSENKRGQGEDSIYWDKSKNLYVGAISDGFTPSGKRRRHKVTGKTKTVVRRKLRELRKELDAGTRVPARYTAGEAVKDWLKRGLTGRDDATVELYRGFAEKHVIPLIGKAKLKELTADDVDDWLHDRAQYVSTRTLRILHSILRRSITHAQRRDRAVRNVALLVTTPEGQEGRESKSFSLDTAKKILVTDEGSRTHAYVVTSLLGGARPEEMRALTWEHVHLEPPLDLSDDEKEEWCPYLEVWRSVRRHGDTKTRLSRRTLALPAYAAEVLRHHRAQQQKTYARRKRAWSISALAFATRDGGKLAAGNVRRDLRKLLRKAGVEDPDDWTTRELRTTFVSLLADHGLSSEDIAPLVGHRSTITTEVVYRKQIRPVINKGAKAMDDVFADVTKKDDPQTE